ncbi:MAG: alkene reductase [Luminiphilus sp.]|nr:alkene reductase [Luminiphilus sp.]
MKYAHLYSPLEMGDLRLRNRIVMAPMTRSRARQDDDAVSELQANYYGQRGDAGLIVTEGVHPSADGKGYNRTPGIYNELHTAAWLSVTRRVHERGGLIACQLMHCGRVGHALNKGPNTRFLAPSAVAASAEIFTESGMQPMPTPQAMTVAEVKSVVADYQSAAARALQAGFDAVELHCASGYLPAQFLATGSNLRDDQYGGNLENRLRFIEDVLKAIKVETGAGRMGLRISPGNPYNDHVDNNPKETYAALLQLANRMGLAWVHAIRMASTGIDSLALSRANFSGALIGSDSFDAGEADQFIADGLVEAVSFGRAFIANPDLVTRFALDAPLNALDKRTIYAGEGAGGYTDYPNLSS